MSPKYDIGDKVKFHKDSDNEAGEVLSYAYDPQVGEFRYTISSREVDLTEKKVLEGVKTCLESELLEEGMEPTRDEVVEVPNE